LNIAIAAPTSRNSPSAAGSPHFKGDPIYCAIAAYHGSWDRPDNAFADAVRTSVVKNDAPDFEMPAEPGTDFSDAKSAPQPAFHDTATAPAAASDDRQRGWSSALFPAKPQPLDRLSTNGFGERPPALDLQEADAPSARSPSATLRSDGLFVPRSAQRGSQ